MLRALETGYREAITEFAERLHPPVSSAGGLPIRPSPASPARIL